MIEDCREFPVYIEVLEVWDRDAWKLAKEGGEALSLSYRAFLGGNWRCRISSQAGRRSVMTH